MTYDYAKLDADWQRIFTERDPSPTAGSVSTLVRQATDATGMFHDEGTAYVRVAPGTGWEFVTVLHDLERIVPAHEQMFGGRLLVAWPSWHLSLVLNHGLHTPDYLAEKTKLDWQHTIPLAIFLTAFSEAVSR